MLWRGKLATPWFHRAPNAFFASYLAVFGSYLVFEEEAAASTVVIVLLGGCCLGDLVRPLSFH